MDYELALKLKDAGFPQPESVKIPDSLPTSIINTSLVWEPKENIYTPSLSKLIEACGNKFQALHKFQTTFQACGGNYKDIDFECAWEYETEGKTPEEAVSNLWLALNNN